MKKRIDSSTLCFSCVQNSRFATYCHDLSLSTVSFLPEALAKCYRFIFPRTLPARSLVYTCQLSSSRSFLAGHLRQGAVLVYFSSPIFFSSHFAPFPYVSFSKCFRSLASEASTVDLVTATRLIAEQRVCDIQSIDRCIHQQIETAPHPGLESNYARIS